MRQRSAIGLLFGLGFWLVAGGLAHCQNAQTPAQLNTLFAPCASRSPAQPPTCIGSGAYVQSLIATLAGRTAIAMTDYGAKFDGTTDDTAAINAADTAAAAAGAALYCPSGKTAVVNGALHANSWWFSLGTNCNILFKTDIGHGAWWQAGADNAIAGVILEAGGMTHVSLWGPGCSAPTHCSYSVGVAPANMNGLQFGATAASAPSPFFDHMQIEGFYAGLVVNTNYGHWHLQNSQITNNFYNTYNTSTGGDVNETDDDLTGAAMASQACSANGACFLSNGAITNVHTGFSPYAYYREPSIGPVTFGGFMNGMAFVHSGFECVGNAAMKVAQAAVTGDTITGSVKIVKHGGFTWDSSTYCRGGHQLSLTPQSKTCTVATANNPGSGLYNGSGLLVSCTATPVLSFGQEITGTGIAAHSYVLADDGAGNVHISLPVTSSPGAETVQASFDNSLMNSSPTLPDYAIDWAELDGVFDADMGSAPADPFNNGGAIEPGALGIVHAQACSDVSNANGGRVILRYTDAETPPHGNNQGALYVCDSDPFGSGAAAASRVTYGNGYGPAGKNLFTLTITSPATSASTTFPLSLFAAGGTDSGLGVDCTPTSDPGTGVRVFATMSQGTSPSANVETLKVTASGAPATNTKYFCVLNGPE